MPPPGSSVSAVHGVGEVDVPSALRRNVSEVWGDDGRGWLERLPAIVQEVAHTWGLVVGAPYVLSLNWVASVRCPDGTPAVLKLGVPESGHLTDEATALRCFGGGASAGLLSYDPDRGALLLEHVRPGTLLRQLVPDRDEEATAVVIDLLRELHAPAPRDVRLPELAAHGISFRRHLDERPEDPLLPRSLVARACAVFDDLVATATERVVLHADLHHDNVLRGERRPWLAIDPHGVVGDPGYEIAPLLYNPDPGRHDDGLLARVPRRLEQLADGLGIPYDRAVAWGFAGAVLSAVWDAEGGSPDGRALDVARMLEPRLARW